jgi:hypothetical protein
MEIKPVIDWERIEKDYRAGILSVREIAASHGITHGAINKRAKRDSWERDLAARIQAKADQLVSKQAVSSKVSADTKITDNLIIETNARVVADVRITHRTDINRYRNLAIALLDELEQQTGNLGDLSDLGVLLRSENDKGVDKLNDIYQAVISTPSRVDSVKKLAEVLRILIGLEREAYGMNAVAKENEMTELAAKIEEARKRANGS